VDADVKIHQGPPDVLGRPVHPAQEGRRANEDPQDHLVQVVTAVHADAALFLKVHVSAKYGATVVRFLGMEAIYRGNVFTETHPAMRKSGFVQMGDIW